MEAQVYTEQVAEFALALFKFPFYRTLFNNFII